MGHPGIEKQGSEIRGQGSVDGERGAGIASGRLTG
jgi:hypothetical protein